MGRVFSLTALQLCKQAQRVYVAATLLQSILHSVAEVFFKNTSDPLLCVLFLNKTLDICIYVCVYICVCVCIYIYIYISRFCFSGEPHQGKENTQTFSFKALI